MNFALCKTLLGEPQYMSQKPESKFWRKIKPYLEALPNTYIERVQQVSIRGTPDVFLCINGYFIAMELKKDEDTEPDKLQEWRLDLITKAKGIAVTVHPGNWDGVYNMLKDIACAEVEHIYMEKH